MQIIEEFLMPKTGPGKTCGDAIYYDSHFACVVDGATSKTKLLWNGKSADVFVSKTLISAIGGLCASMNAYAVFGALADRLTEECEKQGVDLSGLAPYEKPQASIVIYSVRKKELWCLGDCCYLLNGKEHRNTKRVDELLSQLRTFVHEVCVTGGGKSDWGEDERRAILPFLEQQAWLANKESSFGYGVFDGSYQALNFIRTIPVKDGDQVVISSDGYPRLFPTLAQSEAYLAGLLAKDPSCFYELRGTKGVLEGNVSYDDRAYLSFIA